MRVNGKDILRSEFEYSYRHRTGNADAKLSPKEYGELFAQSKLKVEAAKVAALDTTTTVSYTHLFGYTVEGGSIAVGKASTDSVVSSSVLILFADLILTKLLMG